MFNKRNKTFFNALNKNSKITDPFIEKIRAKKALELAEEKNKKEGFICLINFLFKKYFEVLLTNGLQWFSLAAIAQKYLTIALITPDVPADKHAEVTQKIKDKGYEIIETKEVTLTQEQAHELFKAKEATVNYFFFTYMRETKNVKMKYAQSRQKIKHDTQKFTFISDDITIISLKI